MAGLGTGLGVVKCVRQHGGQFVVEPTEAGHMSMIVENEFDIGFQQFIRQKRNMLSERDIVSMEYFVSGIGSKLLYQYICIGLGIQISSPLKSFKLIHTQEKSQEMIIFKEKYNDYVLKVITTIICTFL